MVNDPKEITLNASQLLDIIHNATSRSTELLKKLMDPRRDIDSECGYPAQIEVTDYRHYYDVHGVATRVVEVMPKECWQVQPKVYEDEDPQVQTPFEKAWDEMSNSLRGKSYHKCEEGSPIWDILKRADILSGIGHFGVILLGFDDGAPLSQPVPMLQEDIDAISPPKQTGPFAEYSTSSMGSIDAQYEAGFGVTQEHNDLPVLQAGTKRRLLYMRPFDESMVQVIRLETDRRSPRYGQPLAYRITLSSPEADNQQSVVGADMSNPEVHWTRVIHIVDNSSSSEVWGTPRQKPVWRHLMNLYKLYGAAPEMYWRGALNGLSFETHPSLGGDVLVDTEAHREMIENFRNSLQRDLTTSGMTVKSIAPTVVDPTPNIEVQIGAICIQIAIPLRVFMGSERGELASSQDDSSWNDRLRARQRDHITPRIIVPTVDRLVATGVLPVPKGGAKKPVEETTIPKGTLPKGKESPAEKPKGEIIANWLRHIHNAFSSGKPVPDAPVDEGITEDESDALAPSTDAEISLPGYTIEWPDLDSESNAQKAAIALQITQALAAFVAGNLEAVIELYDYLTLVIGWTDERAKAVIASKITALKEAERLTPDPEEAQAQQLEMQGKQMEQDHELKRAALDKQPAGGPPGQFKGGKPPVGNQLSRFSGKRGFVVNYSPDQPRDNEGQFSSGGGASKIDPKTQSDWEDKQRNNASLRAYTTENDHGNIRSADSMSLDNVDLKRLKATNPLAYDNAKKRLDNAKKNKKHVEAINKAIDTAPGFEGEVHRGVTIGPYSGESYQSLKTPGATVTLDSFQSWSKSKDTAGKFSKGEDSYTLSVKLSTRTKSADISNIGGTGEGEVLTKRGSQFKVAHVDHDKKSILLEEWSPTTNYSPNQPRDAQGRFGSGGGSKKAGGKGETLFAVTRTEDKKWVDSQGIEAPDHIKKLGIPPAWTDVHVNPNADGDLLAVGKDAKGRTQMKYSDSHNAQATAAKFGRVTELRKKRAEIFQEIAKDAKNPEHKENADCLKVIMQTGIRPGSNQDTKAEHASFGATTLKGSHVQVKPDGSVMLKFATGKNKGREVEFPIHDKDTAAMLKSRAQLVGQSGDLFKTDAQKLRDYSKNKDGKGFKTKDHRTALGTETAITAINNTTAPKTKAEYKNKIKEVATKVSDTLGNTPSVALKSYIDPTVFSEWKASAGVM